MDRSARLLLIAVLAGVFWSIGAIDLNRPQPDRLALLILGGVLGWAVLRRFPVGPLVGAYAVLIAAVERLGREPLVGGSDVLPATAEAIGTLLRGQNPYTHVMQVTIPVGSPLVYPPGEFFFYAPTFLLGGDISRVETWTGILTVAAIAVAGFHVGHDAASLPAMLYATWGIAAFRTVDGGNDVSAAFLVVVALVALAFASSPRPRTRVAALALSALAFGWALAFKQFAVIVFPLVLRHLATTGAPWKRYAVAATLVAAAFIVPFLAWAPGPFLAQQVQALTFHDQVWGANLLHLLAGPIDMTPLLPVFFVLETLLTAAALIIAMRADLTSLGRAAIYAAGVLSLPLLLARWTTQSYYVYAVTVAAAGIALLDVRVGGDRAMLATTDRVPPRDSGHQNI
ncbi:MAG: hypothetical protein M3O91_11095 [Chloroflexota bacterium]|nr:hypothetical protein [Chloroflexota bacterium]